MTSPQPVYTAHDVGDLFASLPTLFGFTPTESLVAISTSGDRRRFGFRLRQDLPAVHQVSDAADVAAAHLSRHASDGVVLLVVTRQGGALALSVLEAVIRRLDPRLQLVACGWADGERYWEPVPGFPAAGEPYASGHHLSVVEAVAAGMEILPDRAALVRRFAACTGAVRDRMVAVTEGVMLTELPRVGGDPVGAALPVIDPILAVALDEPDRLSDRDCALLGLWVSSVDVRDEVWGRMDTESARSWLRIWADVAGRVVAPFEPAVLSLASYAAWLAGDGAQARIAADRAHAADPGYSLAALMLELVERGVPPTSWRTGASAARSDGRDERL